jgi:formate C-acetyltransferase
MTKNVEALLRQLTDKQYKKYRIKEKEEPILYPIDFFGFHIGSNRSYGKTCGNVTPNYKRVMTTGFDALCQELSYHISATTDKDKQAYGKAMLEKLNECISVCDNYRENVKEQGNTRLYQALLTVPHKPATTFFEACVFLKLCIYFLRISNIDHIGLGRFDQYMYSFYQRDKAAGVTDEEIFETIEAFFISINFDTDLFFGVQQGDNGQSLVLGGFDKDGNSMYNELTDMCLDASLELNLIDPKINLRVGIRTPDEIFVKATHLTKRGLGFPQYCNDDVVVPGLVELGYDVDDAIDYVVAACWEYIIPGCGADYPNICTMNFPLLVSNVVKEKLRDCNCFEELMHHVEQAIEKECDYFVDTCSGVTITTPLLSVFTDNCTQNLKDMWHGGAKYLNFGCHGAGIANAADALCAIQTCIFEQQSIAPDMLIDALDSNFEGCENIRNLLRACPKMGNNDDKADGIACRLMACFSNNMNCRPNNIGGVWRAGTGSAMEYIWSAEKCPATADGRKASDPYSSSFSPSLDVKTSGMLSIVQSFTKFDMTKIINGGPLTLEIHDSVFRNDIGIKKIAQLVKAFIGLGGHQLQLNSVNREVLLDAQKHPEKYPNLIVRVWGWSGYYNELDTKYQNHIIRRCEYTG